jgi:hypothetical protein
MPVCGALPFVLINIQVQLWKDVSVMLHSVTNDCGKEGNRLIVVIDLLVKKANCTIDFCLRWTVGSVLLP